jgi:hypothetical protein
VDNMSPSLQRCSMTATLVFFNTFWMSLNYTYTTKKKITTAWTIAASTPINKCKIVSTYIWEHFIDCDDGLKLQLHSVDFVHLLRQKKIQQRKKTNEWMNEWNKEKKIKINFIYIFFFYFAFFFYSLLTWCVVWNVIWFNDSYFKKILFLLHWQSWKKIFFRCALIFFFLYVCICFCIFSSMLSFRSLYTYTTKNSRNVKCSSCRFSN